MLSSGGNPDSHWPKLLKKWPWIWKNKQMDSKYREDGIQLGENIL